MMKWRLVLQVTIGLYHGICFPMDTIIPKNESSPHSDTIFYSLDTVRVISTRNQKPIYKIPHHLMVIDQEKLPIITNSLSLEEILNGFSGYSRLHFFQGVAAEVDIVEHSNWYWLKTIVKTFATLRNLFALL